MPNLNIELDEVSDGEEAAIELSEKEPLFLKG